MPQPRKLRSHLINILITLFLIFNIYILWVRIPDDLLEDITLQKPTIVLALDEHECMSCIYDLNIFNDLYFQIESENDIDVLAVIASKDRTDSKNLGEHFKFPSLTTDATSLFERVGHARTPLIVGLSENKEIFFIDTLPMGTNLTHEYIMGTLVDRLHHARNLSQSSQ